MYNQFIYFFGSLISSPIICGTKHSKRYKILSINSSIVKGPSKATNFIWIPTLGKIPSLKLTWLPPNKKWKAMERAVASADLVDSGCLILVSQALTVKGDIRKYKISKHMFRQSFQFPRDFSSGSTKSWDISPSFGKTMLEKTWLFCKVLSISRFFLVCFIWSLAPNRLFFPFNVINETYRALGNLRTPPKCHPPKERIPGGIGGGTGVPLDSHEFYWIPVHPPSLCRVPPNVSTKHSFLSAPLFLLRLSLRPAPKAFYLNTDRPTGKRKIDRHVVRL